MKNLLIAFLIVLSLNSFGQTTFNTLKDSYNKVKNVSLKSDKIHSKKTKKETKKLNESFYSVDFGYLHSLSSTPKTRTYHSPIDNQDYVGNRAKNTASFDLSYVSRKGNIFKLDCQYGRTVVVALGAGKKINKFFVTGSVGGAISFCSVLFENGVEVYVHDYNGYGNGYTGGYKTVYGTSIPIYEMYVSVDAGYQVNEKMKVSATFSNLTGAGIKIGFFLKNPKER